MKETEIITYFLSKNRFGSKMVLLRSPDWEKLLSCLTIVEEHSEEIKKEFVTQQYNNTMVVEKPTKKSSS